MSDHARVKAVPIRRGLYRLLGCRCHCGGEIRVERTGRGAFAWEPFCAACKDCDPNGYATLRETVRETPKFWNSGELNA